MVSPFELCTHFLRVFLFVAILLPVQARGEMDGLPRYKLPIGRTLSFVEEAKSMKEDGTLAYSIRSSMVATVVAANADGSRRVILCYASTFDKQPEEVMVGAFDLFPDGRTKQVGRPNFSLSLWGIFPLLPPDAASAATKWTAPADWTGDVTTYTANPVQATNELTFGAVSEGMSNRLYEVTGKTTFHYDRVKGVIVETDSEASQGYGGKRTNTGKLTLERDEEIGSDSAAKLAGEYDKLLQADARYWNLMNRITDEPASAVTLAGQAKDVLTAVVEGVQEPQVKKEFQRMLDHHERYAKSHHERYAKSETDNAQHIAGLVGKPVEWTAKDLDGKTWSQSDLKGKVVIMDFWYRGCGWCMYAMPQINQLAADYATKPVIVLGMNTDSKEEDARFVTKELGLAYPQIKADEVSRKLAIQSFPTLIIIDQAGVIRSLHAGYSPDLYEMVSKRIDELLLKKLD